MEGDRPLNALVMVLHYDCNRAFDPRVDELPSRSPEGANNPLRHQSIESGLHLEGVAGLSQPETIRRNCSFVQSVADPAARLGVALPHIYHMRDRIPLLQEVFVCISDSLGPTFRSAPQLRVARIVNPRTTEGSVRTQTPEIIFPWSQLSIFETTYDDRRQFDGFLLAPSLIECQITVSQHTITPFNLHIPVPAPWQPPPEPVVFPNLTKLTLDAPAIHLDALILPALEALVIRTSSWEFDRVVHMLTRSACSLRKFWLKTRPPSEQSLQVLSHNPAIFEIGIVGSSIDGPNSGIAEVIAALTLRSQQPVYAPALTRFHIRDTGLNSDAILTMVESRFNLAHLHGCARLQVLVIFDGGVAIHRGRNPMRIATLRAAGLEVEIRSDDTETFRGVLRGKLYRYI